MKMVTALKNIRPVSAMVLPDGTINHGLTRRELFAAMAMQALLGSENIRLPQGENFHSFCVIQADKLCLELDRVKEEKPESGAV